MADDTKYKKSLERITELEDYILELRGEIEDMEKKDDLILKSSESQIGKIKKPELIVMALKLKKENERLNTFYKRQYEQNATDTKQAKDNMIMAERKYMQQAKLNMKLRQAMIANGLNPDML